MSEKLIAKDFIVLKNIEIDVGSVNVIIGPQANGKSLIAKLLYFFQSSSEIFLKAIREQKNKRELDEAFYNKFESFFPRYSWEGSNFSITYKVDGISINFDGVKRKNNKTRLKVTYSDCLIKVFNSKKKLFKKKIEEAEASEKSKKIRIEKDDDIEIFYEFVVKSLKESEHKAYFKSSYFIPASRTFFANLQKNIFTFLASNIEIDPFLKEFGKIYENSKRLYNLEFFKRKNPDLYQSSSKIIERIISGVYSYDDEQDWIISENRKINLVNASSGQQESLPMLISLLSLSFLNSDEDVMLFIEEPEAHLFPYSQSLIISFLSLFCKEFGTSFFITTHSPYILSALNNLSLANDVVENNKINMEEFAELNGISAPISFENIKAYTLNTGKLTNITDSEYRMIGAEILDSVSQDFENVFNELLLRNER
jgi:predicted ATPase